MILTRLQTARMYNGCNTSDLEEVIDNVHNLHPKAKVMAVGVSLGGLVEFFVFTLSLI